MSSLSERCRSPERQRRRVVRECCAAVRADTSGGLPILDTPLRLGEFVATLALAQDNAFGQPLESQLRSCLLATWICEAAGFDDERARDRLLGGAAPLRRLHRPRPRGRHRVRRRDRDPRPDAGPRRRESRRGDARRDGLRDGRAQPGGARRDRPDDPGDRPRVGGLQLLVRVRGGRHARAAARLRPRRSRGAALHVRALERQRLSRPCAGRGDPARDARRAPQPRHGGDRPPLLAGPRPRGRPRSPRPHVRPGARRPVRRARTRLVRSARETEPWDAVLALEPEPHRMLDGERARRRPDRRRRLHRPQVAVHGRAQPSLRASSPPTPPGCSGSPRRPSPRSAARRSCTTSAPPRCRTRSGTSPARSRGRSSIASSFTRC